MSEANAEMDKQIVLRGSINKALRSLELASDVLNPIPKEEVNFKFIAAELQLAIDQLNFAVDKARAYAESSE